MIKILKPDEFKKDRSESTTSAELTAVVSGIITDIIKRGDAALREYTQKFDRCTLNELEVPREALDNALNKVDQNFLEVLHRTRHNIEEFHRRQVREGFVFYPGEGIVLGQRVLPLERVGIYIPGGTAAYPSSVLMNAIPAKLAGVGEIIMVTPPPPGGVNPGILAAARLAGVDRVFTIGGAQAVAALAYGTESVPRVDKITGPGNSYVAEAKRQVFGTVGIDMIAGPSDILIITDESGDPELIAADMLSQCEHGEDSSAVLITTSAKIAKRVQAEIETQLTALPREEIARKAVDEKSAIIIAETIAEAFEISNEIAPEHLEIFLPEAFEHLGLVKNAGSVFLGRHAPEALGDYYAGPNHTLPTAGTARFSSGLSVDDFVKKSSFTYYSEDALRRVGADIVQFAEKEGLQAHALSVSKRIER